MEVCKECDIVYDEISCPLCSANDYWKDLDSDLLSAESRISQLESDIDQLEDLLRDSENRISQLESDIDQLEDLLKVSESKVSELESEIETLESK